MKIVNAGYQILYPDLDNPWISTDIYSAIEQAGRTCYKSEDKITADSAEKFVRTLVQNGHEAMLEHGIMTVKFIVDRGVSHELVRHRLCSFAQESTRYCAYNKDKFGNELTFIKPFYWKEDEAYFNEWKTLMQIIENVYLTMLERGVSPQEARAVLPNSLKTEVVLTANWREWRKIFKLRAAGESGIPHPQMLEVMVPLLNECKLSLPALFEDIQAINR